MTFGDLLAARQRWWRPDDGALIAWQSRDEVLQRLRPTWSGLPKDFSAAHPESLWLRLLGLDILVRCAHADTAREIAAYFSAAVLLAPVRSPDCVIECDWPHAGRYLFRARPATEPPALDGVRVQLPGDPRPLPWRGHQPPVPPIGGSVTANRFVGLHAAACMHPSGQVVIFAGERRSGKTTTAMHLTLRHGWTLLTDETVFLVRRTRIVEPFVRSIGLAAQIDHTVDGAPPKVLVPATEVIPRFATEPESARYLVFLEPDEDSAGPSLDIIRPSEAISHLLPHHLDVGTDADESLVTLMQVAERCPAAVFRYPLPTDLLTLPAALENAWALRAARDESQQPPESLFYAGMDLTPEHERIRQP